MKFLIKHIIFIIIASTFLDLFKNQNSNFKILASENAGVDINFGDSIGVNQNIMNLKNRKKIYEKEIIEKVKKGGAIDTKMGKAIFGVRSFFREDYCKEIGEYAIIGTVSYPTWCNRDSGPFSNIKNPNKNSTNIDASSVQQNNVGGNTTNININGSGDKKAPPLSQYNFGMSL